MKNEMKLYKKLKTDSPMIVQILVLACICFIGELLASTIPINCSSAVYDFVIVFLLLQFKVIKLEWIEKLSNILSSCMLIAFVPGTVNIINAMEEALQMIFPAIIAATIGTVIVLIVSGWSVQLLMNLLNKLKGEKSKC